MYNTLFTHNIWLCLCIYIWYLYLFSPIQTAGLSSATASNKRQRRAKLNVQRQINRCPGRCFLLIYIDRYIHTDRQTQTDRQTDIHTRYTHTHLICTNSGYFDPSSHRTCSENFDTRQWQPYENGQFQKRYRRRTCWGIVSTGRKTQETMNAKHLDYDMAQNSWWPKWFQQLQCTTCSNTAISYQQRNLATFLTRLYPGHRN